MDKRVWIITGCSSGFGRAIAEAALEEGHHVALTARKPESVQDIIEAFPEKAIALELDVTDSEQINQVVKKTAEHFGRIDVLVNNAGYGLLGALEETSLDQMRANFETNLFGPIAMIRAVMPFFRAQKSGHIFNMSAKAGFDNYPGFGVYGATKYALEGVSEAVAKEAASFGVKVTSIEPGPFRTNFAENNFQKGIRTISDYDGTVRKFEKILNHINGKQKGDPEKAAALIVKVADSENPPARLPLGVYAVKGYKEKLQKMLDDLNVWEKESTETDYR